MSKKQYAIPQGTPILWRNVEHELKLKPHVTESSLKFDEIKCTGDGGQKCYFELGEWLIVVDAEFVLSSINLRHRNKVALTEDQAPSAIEHCQSLNFPTFLSHAISDAPLLKLCRA